MGSKVEPAKSFKPAVLVRLAALDDLVANARYLVKQAGRAEEAKQFERLLKSRTGPKGLEGIDTKKPIGLYGSAASQLLHSRVVLLVPIADEETFLSFLETIDFKPEKDKTGLYSLTVPIIPFPLEFRFANGYLYASLKLSDKAGLPAKDELPLPSTVLAGGAGVLSVTANIDQIPSEIRKVGISGSALHLGNLKDETPPGETAAHKALREAILDEAAVQVKSVLTDGAAVMLKLDVDWQNHDLSLSLSFAGKDGSPLAKELISLGQAKSLGAALIGSDSAVSGFLHLSLPKSIRKVLGPAVDEVVKKGLDNLDAGARELLSPLADALKATAKEGTLDVGMSIRGPAKNGKYTLVSSLRVKHGNGIDKAFRTVLDNLPEEAKRPIKIDIAKAHDVSIHRIELENMTEQALEFFGDGPLFFAVRDDAFFVAVGDKALDAIKHALGVKPKAGHLAELDLSLSRIAKLMAAQNKEAPEAAKKAFKEEGSDKVRLSVSSGSKIEVKLNVKSAVITFAALMDKAKKEAEEK